jgi:hypothetical protein
MKQPAFLLHGPKSGLGLQEQYCDSQAYRMVYSAEQEVATAAVAVHALLSCDSWSRSALVFDAQLRVASAHLVE